MQSRMFHYGVLAVALSVSVIGGGPNAFGDEPAKKSEKEPAWTPLFDGKDLGKWKITRFGGQGDVLIEDETLVMEMGSPLTGITWTGDVPKTNFEISLEAKRVDGIDFFCGLTFPVQNSHCSFIVGGWGGAVVGISSIDGNDAARNETTSFMKFKTGQWYRIRVQVTPDRIKCWIDDEAVVDQNIRDRKITTRNEVDLSKPMGICAYETKAALRNLRIRKLYDQ